ncbi:MAG: phenylalanine--tRNA ligase subunit alpha, partial [Alphaproteobacteria bacterium]|nr:phenylalanine--tRNA ligase subunit alpha [Alphaproteobacteria bacterium]
MIDNNLILKQINDTKTTEELEAIKVSVLGKNGVLTSALKELGKMTPDERKTVGAELNVIKDEILGAMDKKKSALEMAEINAKLESEKIDITLTKQEPHFGYVHPLSKVKEELVQIFASLGFKVENGPDIEDDFHNFTALNVPSFHPARSMQDTFFVEGGNLLRTQTSSVQIRSMEKTGVPIKVITMGRVYRSDWDATHTPMFHQIEGLYIDKNVTMAHLKGCLLDFLKMFFETADVPIQFRPSYFPFTEPSAEMDIRCTIENGELKIGANGKRWLEILGCGMVHPNVLKSVGVNPDEYQGFAFGMGIERLTMLKYGISDMRKCFETDTRWLSQI